MTSTPNRCGTAKAYSLMSLWVPRGHPGDCSTPSRRAHAAAASSGSRNAVAVRHAPPRRATGLLRIRAKIEGDISFAGCRWD